MPTRNIILPPVHNTRAPEQWRIISEHVDFDDKTVLDLGCGYGDLLWRAWGAGAFQFWGIDYSSSIVKRGNDFARKENDFTLVDFIERDIEKWILDVAEKFGDITFDIIICFSVLPYLADPVAALHWIREHSTQALIECQLAGDGPGFDWLKSSQDMRRWLDSIGWKSVERIGWTVIKDRGTSRGIWLCQQ